MKAIVVGAGVVGASVAYRLAQAGADVTIVEERRPGGGTSSVTYAWVNACEKLTSHAYFRLNFAGRQAHEAILAEFPGADWYHRPGVLQWQDAEAEAGGRDGTDPLSKLRQLVEWGYPAEVLSLDDVRKLEPDLAPEAIGNAPVIHYPQDGWLDPVPYAGALVGAAIERHGAQFMEGRAERLVLAGDRCEGIVLADGRALTADVVVNCAGRWLNEFIERPEHRIPLAPTLGIVAYTPPSGARLHSALRTPLVNMRPDGGGRFLLRSNELDRLLETDEGAVPAHPQAQELMRRAAKTIPALAKVQVEAVRIATRPIPKDSYSAVGPVPGLGNYYAVVTHSGVTLGAFLGEAVADELVNGRSREELAEFRPSRFFN
ncbi:MAG TPA: FAD-binding oxidoreductase [Bosea sp. (in: a-proteobacteria)]|jgi:glycine/D-amino acid oxidase-like deaminating enzyme|uniref:NAD(P)/FAD-dependent oxidoreductase n=1 Tax=Bosea sp. (in: a-proteobacteria) TaxID=1871050 RepID=UPI002E104C3F|nr:FAD-binding oxidoreductase [Bosea sp. (in: a-proteobacteria)]